MSNETNPNAKHLMKTPKWIKNIKKEEANKSIKTQFKDAMEEIKNIWRNEDEKL